MNAWKFSTAFAILLMSSASHAQSVCTEVFDKPLIDQISPQARKGLADRLKELMADIERTEQLRIAEAKKQAELDRQAEEALSKQIDSITTLHDFNQLPAEARLRAIEWQGLKNLPTKSSGDGRKDTVGGGMRVKIKSLKDPVHKEFAAKMLDYMKANSDVQSDRGISVEVITTLDGQVVGGNFRHQANRNEYVEGVFDGAMTPLKVDFSLQYEH